jgi:replication fork protection complex subunit Tof1/Swi1
VLEETHVMNLLLTIAANTDSDPLFSNWNALVLDIFYLLFRGVKPDDLVEDQAKVSPGTSDCTLTQRIHDQRPTANLAKLLQAEERSKRDVQRKASTRHSRFGTTITVQLKKAPAPAVGALIFETLHWLISSLIGPSPRP